MAVELLTTPTLRRIVTVFEIEFYFRQNHACCLIATFGLENRFLLPSKFP